MAAAVEARGVSGLPGLPSLPLDEAAGRVSCLLSRAVFEGEPRGAFELLVENRVTGFACLVEGGGGELTLALLDGVAFGAHLLWGDGGEAWGVEALEEFERGARGPVRLYVAEMSVEEVLSMA